MPPKPTNSRRRTKQQILVDQQRAAAASQAQANAQAAQDDSAGIHDEADVMSFRTLGAQRFMFNIEMIENVTDKWIHTDAVKGGTPYPKLDMKNEGGEVGKTELYFGDRRVMKVQAKKLRGELKRLKKEAEKEKEEFLKPNRTLNDIINTLTTIPLQPTSEEHESQLNDIQKKFQETTAKQIYHTNIKTHSLPQINPNPQARASPSYWAELRHLKIQAAQAAAAQEQAVALHQTTLQMNSNSLVMGPVPDPYQSMMNDDDDQNAALGFADPASYVQADDDQGAFAAEGAIIDDVQDDVNVGDDDGFGFGSGLDDQDFLGNI